MPIGFTRLQAYGNRSALKSTESTSQPNLQLSQADAVHFSGKPAENASTQASRFSPRRLLSRLFNALMAPLRWPLAKFGLAFPKKELTAPTPLHPPDQAKNPFAVSTAQLATETISPEVEAQAKTESLNKDAAAQTPEVSFGSHTAFSKPAIRNGATNPFALRETPAPQLLYPGINDVENAPQLFWNAVMAGDVDQARHFIERGIDVNVRQVDGSTPLLEASSRGNLPMVLLLLEAPDIQPNAKNQRGSRPIHKAVIENHPDVVAALLQKKVKLEVDSWYENKPLQLAANLGHEQIVKQLLQHGAEVNSQSWQGYTPLYWASEHGHLPVVRDLLAHGAKVTIQNQYGETPLHGVARGGHANVMDELLAAEGADPNAADKRGETPLHRAAARDHLDVLDKLKAKGGDMNLPALNGETPQDILDKRRLIRAGKGLP